MREMMQDSFYFNLVPTLAVQKGKPTRHWRRIEKPEDAFEQPEWACLTYLQRCSQPAGINSQVDLVSGVATVSLGQMCADLCMANSSLHRTLHRLEKMGLIKLTKRGCSRKQLTNWTVFNPDAVREAILTSRCTHYCMQGGARKLYQADPDPQS